MTRGGGEQYYRDAKINQNASYINNNGVSRPLDTNSSSFIKQQIIDKVQHLDENDLMKLRETLHIKDIDNNNNDLKEEAIIN